MSLTTKHLLIFALLLTLSYARSLPKLTSFDKELIFQDRRVLLSSSQDVVTDQDSYVYAVCSSQEKTFKENRCNVTIETPAFVNATFRDTCALKFAPERRLESVTKLQLQPFGDDKVLLSWQFVDDDHLKPRGAKVRVLRMSNCRYSDVDVPAENIHGLVAYEDAFEVILSNKTFCVSDSCRLSFNVEGKKLAGPTQFLSNVKFSSISTILPVVPRSPTKGFYVVAYGIAGMTRPFILQATPEGKGIELLKTDNVSTLRLSNTHDTLSVCWTSERTNITCRQFDSTKPFDTKQLPTAKLNVVNGFLDERGYDGVPIRWIQQHNLKEGGLLLVTGQAGGKELRRLESFTVLRIHPDGHRDRPLEVIGLDFECTNIRQLRVNIAENDEDEICFHFICDRDDFDRAGIRNTLKLSTKCLPKKYVVMTKHRAAFVN